jgi:hypothetical protein
VSNREGGEDTTKLRAYAQLRIPYYVIHDPEDLLGGGVLRIFEINRGKYQSITATPVTWLEEVGLGLTLWQGVFEGIEATWLRWCDKEGNLIPTGAEAKEQADRRADEERQRADEERQRAEQALQEVERLKAQLRDLGAEPAPAAPTAAPKAKPKRKRK